jgi:hypothetical protein
MISRERIMLVMFLLAVIFFAQAVTPRNASSTSCSIGACGFALHFGPDFAALNLK